MSTETVDHIVYEFDSERLLRNYEDVDVADLFKTFEAYMYDVLREEFPGAYIEVVEGFGRLQVYDDNGDLSSALYDKVDAVIQDAWATFEWTE